MAAQGVVVIILEVPSGALTDAWGRRPVFLASAVVAIIAYCVTFVAQSWSVFALAWAISGVFRALDSGPLEAWFVDAEHARGAADEVPRGLAAAGGVISAAIAAGALTTAGPAAGAPVVGGVHAGGALPGRDRGRHRPDRLRLAAHAARASTHAPGLGGWRRCARRRGPRGLRAPPATAERPRCCSWASPSPHSSCSCRAAARSSPRTRRRAASRARRGLVGRMGPGRAGSGAHDSCCCGTVGPGAADAGPVRGRGPRAGADGGGDGRRRPRRGYWLCYLVHTSSGAMYNSLVHDRVDDAQTRHRAVRGLDGVPRERARPGEWASARSPRPRARRAALVVGAGAHGSRRPLLVVARARLSGSW